MFLLLLVNTASIAMSFEHILYICTLIEVIKQITKKSYFKFGLKKFSNFKQSIFDVKTKFELKFYGVSIYFIELILRKCCQ